MLECPRESDNLLIFRCVTNQSFIVGPCHVCCSRLVNIPYNVRGSVHGVIRFPWSFTNISTFPFCITLEDR